MSTPMDAVTSEAALNEPKTPYEYVSAWFFKKGYAINAREEIEFSDRRENMDVTITQLHCDYNDSHRERRLIVRTYNENLPNKRAEKLPSPIGFTVKELDNAIRIYIKTKADEAFEALKERLTYSKEAETSKELEKMLEIVRPNHSSLDVAVFKHIIWQVKQRLWNRKSRHELIVSFFGKQGAGKTTLVRQLAEPIKELFVERKMSDIVGDERNSFMLQKAYLILFEELENASRVDIDSLKALTSKDAMNWRILGKNLDGNGFMNTTFVCTSNKPIRQVFYDPTGMRRFYEITVVDEIPRRKINAVNFLKIWQSVDEAAECPIENRIKELYEHQNTEYKAQSTVEAFLEEKNIKPSLDVEKRIPLKQLYKDYKDFCEEYGFKSPVSVITFSHDLTSQGYGKVRHSKGVMIFADKPGTVSLANVRNMPVLK